VYLFNVDDKIITNAISVCSDNTMEFFEIKWQYGRSFFARVPYRVPYRRFASVNKMSLIVCDLSMYNIIILYYIIENTISIFTNTIITKFLTI